MSIEIRIDSFAPDRYIIYYHNAYVCTIARKAMSCCAIMPLHGFGDTCYTTHQWGIILEGIAEWSENIAHDCHRCFFLITERQRGDELRNLVNFPGVVLVDQFKNLGDGGSSMMYLYRYTDEEGLAHAI